MDIAEFLLARIAEREEVARKATQGRWKLWGMQVLADPVGNSDLDDAVQVAVTTHETGLRTFNAEHIAYWDPARVLAGCEAKRKIVERYCLARTVAYEAPEKGEHLVYAALHGVVLAHVQPYSDHPDFDPAWRS